MRNEDFNFYFLLPITEEICVAKHIFLQYNINKKHFSTEINCTYLVKWIENYYDK